MHAVLLVGGNIPLLGLDTVGSIAEELLENLS